MKWNYRVERFGSNGEHRICDKTHSLDVFLMKTFHSYVSRTHRFVHVQSTLTIARTICFSQLERYVLASPNDVFQLARTICFSQLERYVLASSNDVFQLARTVCSGSKASSLSVCNGLLQQKTNNNSKSGRITSKYLQRKI